MEEGASREELERLVKPLAAVLPLMAYLGLIDPAMLRSLVAAGSLDAREAGKRV